MTDSNCYGLPVGLYYVKTQILTSNHGNVNVYMYFLHIYNKGTTDGKMNFFY